MKMQDRGIKSVIIAALVLSASVASAQVNTWRGDESGAEWNDRYKWKLKHAPTGDEAVHFREPNSSININSTVQLNNGMHLYGQELSLRGNGNVNLQSQIPHQRTVNIPASATGFANMTIRDNLTLNGRIALSAKGFGTSASKGTITLRDRSNVNGILSVGNDGHGTGQVFVKGSSTFHITGLELKTQADSGGSAEIHVLGGTVYIETKENPYNVFLEDPSRKIILGDAGTLRIEYIMPISQKKREVKSMILEDRLVAAPGCNLTLPVIQNDMMIIRGEDARNGTKFPNKQALVAAIDRISNGPSVASSGKQPTKLNSILSAMRGNTSPSAASSEQPKKLDSILSAMRGNVSSSAASSEQPKKLDSILSAMRGNVSPDASGQNEAPAGEEEQDGNGGEMAGYIVFFGTILLVLRRADEKQEKE